MRQKGGSRFDKLVPIPLLSPPQTNSKATTFQLISIVLMIILVTLVYLLDPFKPISFLSPVKFSDVESCVTVLLEWTSKSKCTFLGTIFIDQFSRRLFCRLSIDPSSRDSIWSHAIYQCRHPKHCWSSSSLVRWRSLASPTEHPIVTCESHVCHKRS